MPTIGFPAPRPPERPLFRNLAIVVALYLWRESIEARTEARLQRSLLDAALQGRLDPVNDTGLVERARLLGLALDRTYYMVAWDTRSTRPLSGSARWPDNLPEWEDAIRTELADWRPLLSHVDGKIVTVLMARSDRTAAHLAHRLTPFFQTHPDATAVWGGPVAVGEFQRLYIALSRVMAATPSRGLIGLDALLVWRALAELPNALMDTYWQQTWGRLQTPDQAEVLAAFIEHFGRMAESARALGIHRNTLLRRLREVEMVLGRMLSDITLWELSLVWRWHRTRPTFDGRAQVPPAPSTR